MRIDGTSPVSEGLSGQGADGSTVVRSGENTLADVASRLGVSVDDLKNANPQLAGMDELSPGTEIRLPEGKSDDGHAVGDGDKDKQTRTDSGASKRMEGNLDAAAMRGILFSSLGSSSNSSSSAVAPQDGTATAGGTAPQPPITLPAGTEGYSPAVKKDLTEKLQSLNDNPQFKGLSSKEKDMVLKALTSDPKLDDEKKAKTLDLLGSTKDLSAGDRQIALDGLKGAKADPKYAENLKKIIDDPKFKSLSDAEKTAVLSQAKNYPDARTAGNIDRMLHKDWFTSQSLEDKQRSLKTVARFSANPVGDRKLIDNTLDKFLGDKADYKLVWKTYPSGNGTTFGEGADKTLWLNKGIVAADNDKMVENSNTSRLSLNTVAHEVNHLVNDDKVAKTFGYFQAEYRAWFAGFQSQNGRAPTNQEAMEQRLRWQLNPDSFYGKYAGEAMKDPAEAKKFYDFLGSVTGMKVDASNWKDVVNNSKPEDWKSKSTDPAPTPTGNIDNH